MTDSAPACQAAEAAEQYDHVTTGCDALGAAASIVLPSSPVAARSLSASPAGRPGTGDEVAAAVEFLLSEQAGFISGVALPVDRAYRWRTFLRWARATPVARSLFGTDEDAPLEWRAPSNDPRRLNR